VNNSEGAKEQTKAKPVMMYGMIDERTRAVAAAGDTWACRFLMFALLLDIGCRAVMLKQSSWDLWALLIVAGAISAVYQHKHHVFAKDEFRKGQLLMAGIAIIVAAGMVALLMMLKWAFR
jgi:hypothetical protein